MKLTSRDFVKAILLKEEFDGREQIRQTVLPLFEQSSAPIVEKLSTLIIITKNNKKTNLEECLKELTEKFLPVMEILSEQGIKLPEEEVELAKIVKAIYEEGEAPTTSTTGIDHSTPRIKRKQSTDVPNTQA